MAALKKNGSKVLNSLLLEILRVECWANALLKFEEKREKMFLSQWCCKELVSSLRTLTCTFPYVDLSQVDRIKLSHDHTGYGSGFFVEEVEVEVPAREDRVKFPCRCWLAQDVDDGKIEREMFAITPLPSKLIQK